MTGSRSARTGELDYHLARVLLLVAALRETPDGSADGLTKIAKLDFLLRYPSMLERVLEDRDVDWTPGTAPTTAERTAVESAMVRYKYGPWDDRYYPILGTLIGTGLVHTRPGRGRVTVVVTPRGQAIAEALAAMSEWATVAARSALLADALGAETGNALKELIYRVLPDAVDRPHRERIGRGPAPAPATAAAGARPPAAPPRAAAGEPSNPTQRWPTP